ncbi:MAG: trimethylamine methyltransferase [Desulfitibacter sp. BRH_c19]|nr:MAG: trimethylamine methyltransferase [Desulfitibacter sp. BRH_c19]
MLELGITFSFEQFVMDNDIIKMVNKVVQGIDINDETLAVDVIKQVGAGGDFLMQEHTMKHMRTAQSSPKLMNRKMKHSWVETGSKNLTEVAREEAINILENHKPEPLMADIASKLADIIEAAEEEFGVNKK